MEDNTLLYWLWESTGDFQFPPYQEPSSHCVFSRAFQQWIDRLQEEILTATPTAISVNQAKVLLLDRYFDWLQNVPKSHRNRLGEAGHICIYQVFCQAYQQIRSLELSLIPPMLFVPPQPHLPGLYLGEQNGSADE